MGYVWEELGWFGVVVVFVCGVFFVYVCSFVECLLLNGLIGCLSWELLIMKK